MRRSRILGVGSYVPPNVWKNDDLKKLMDTSDEWIQQRTGIKERHWVDINSDMGNSDLALQASLRAIDSAKIGKEEIEMIVLATLSPDFEFPGTACFLQDKLGLPGIAALDIRQQCTGFIYALSVADQFIRTGMFKKILVVGSEVHSRGIDKTTNGRDVTVLFGDGAGAVVLGATDATDSKAPQIFSTHLHADGHFARELWLKVGGSAYPGDRLTPELLKEGGQYPKMNGKAVFVNAVKRMPEALQEAVQANGMSFKDVDLFLLHQANLRINEMVAKQLELPEEKVFNTIDRFANTTAATIPLGMDEAVKAGKLKPGMVVALAAFGSGFTWGSALLRW